MAISTTTSRSGAAPPPATTAPPAGAAPAPAAAAEPATVQGGARIAAALRAVNGPARVDLPLIAAGSIAWLLVAVLVVAVPDDAALAPRDVAALDLTTTFGIVAAVVVAAIAPALLLLRSRGGRVGAWAHQRLAYWARWYLGAGTWFLLWEFLTAKTQLLATPYFVSPRAIAAALWTERGILSESLGNSLLLLATGLFVGVLAGLSTGVLIGWFQGANYWVHPFLVFIGPVPSLALVPIVFVLIPNAYTGAVFMIALSVWFPVSVLTRAGILSVPRSYFDVAQTLGADQRFLVRRIAVPAALPSIFTGAFMALGSSFVSLTVAENFGVNSGLGWFLNWKKGWGDYTAVYAGIVLLVLVCGLLLTLLFRTRNWVLRWEKGLTRW